MDQELNDAEPVAMCSRCGAKQPLVSTMVLPAWNESAEDFLTSFRCERCWRGTLLETRVMCNLDNLNEDIRDKICAFLEFHGFETQSQKVRQASLEEAVIIFRQFFDCLEEGFIILKP